VNVSSLETSLSAMFLFFCFSGSNKTKVESLSWAYKVTQYNLQKKNLNLVTVQSNTMIN
jgi:hypothetical protein